jgi:hypothetical protein
MKNKMVVITVLTMKGMEFVHKKSYLTDSGKFNWYLSTLAKELQIQNQKLQLSHSPYHGSKYISMCLTGKFSSLSFNVMNSIETIVFYAQTENKFIKPEFLNGLIEEFNPNEYGISIIVNNTYFDIKQWIRKRNDSKPEYNEKTIYQNAKMINEELDKTFTERYIMGVDFGKENTDTMVIAKQDSEGNLEEVKTINVPSALPTIDWTKNQMLEYAKLHNLKIDARKNKKKILDILLNGE